MENDNCRYVIIENVKTPDDLRSLAAIGEIEAISVFSDRRMMVHLHAVVTRVTGEIIEIKEPWRKCEPMVYEIKTIEWVEYLRRGTVDEYWAKRRSVEVQQIPK